jgi:RNA polymerase sigma-B factor
MPRPDVSDIETESPTSVSPENLARLARADKTRALLAALAATTGPAERRRFEEQVVETNMRIAAQIASRFRNRGVPDEDLEQVAYLALVKAVRRYEFGADRDFLAFAVPTIRGELRRHFRDVGWTIRPTRYIQEAQSHIGRAEGELFQELGRSPRPSEIADHIGLDPKVVIEALSANGCFAPASLESVMTHDDGGPSDWLEADEAGFHQAEARAMLEPLLPRLTDQERLMLKMRFFHDATQVEIGAAIGASQGRVSRLLSDLLARLRDELIQSEKTSHPRQRPAA